MDYQIRNDVLALTASSRGAELQALYSRDKEDWGSLLWDGTPEIWPRRAPVCFPWCGKMEDGWFQAEGRRWEASQHGFIRDMEHTCTEQGADFLEFQLDWPGEESRWPWRFSFRTRHELAGNAVLTTCTAENRDDRPMPVQLGFHPGLRCPFVPGKGREAFQIRFQRPEAPGGQEIFPLEEHVFDHDSICFSNLTSQWIQLEEKETGRYLRVDTGGFPFVLLWSKPGIPGFVCIEPWTGYPGPGHDLAARPGAVVLQPGARLVRTQRITVNLD